MRKYIILLFCLFFLSSCDYFDFDNEIFEETLNDVINSIGDLKNITDDIDFIYEMNGINIEYSSSNPAILTNNGIVDPSWRDRIVDLKLTMTNSYKKEIVRLFLVIKKGNNSSGLSIKDIKKEGKLTCLVLSELPGDKVLVEDESNAMAIISGISNDVGKGDVINIDVEREANEYANNFNAISHPSIISKEEISKDNIIMTDDLEINNKDGKIIYLENIAILKEEENSTSCYHYAFKSGTIILKNKLNYENLEEFTFGYLYQTKDSDNNNIFYELANTTVEKSHNANKRVEQNEYLKELVETSKKELPPLPSTGNVNVLVIPVEFSDCLLSEKYPDGIQRLNDAIFGKDVDTGYESVSSYYEASSYNKLKIEGDITPVFSLEKTSAYYKRKNKLSSNVQDYILEEALTYFDKDYDYTKYDNNNDGIIDAVYIIYTAEVDFDNDSIWWAYASEYEGNLSYNEKNTYVIPGRYLFAGFDFLDEMIKDYSYKNEEGVKLITNSSTFIHETGHLLGLEDYYDYNDYKGLGGGLGGCDMMDSTIGDHNPFSKMILGWTSPTIVNKSGEYSLYPFGETGDSVIIANNFDNVYSEYYILSYYTPDGLNRVGKGMNGLFSTSGIIVYHVIAISSNKEGSKYSTDDSNYYSVFSYNNSDTDYKLIEIIENDTNYLICDGYYADDSDLFQKGDVLSFNRNKSLRWRDGKRILFSIQFLGVKNEKFEIKVQFN